VQGVRVVKERVWALDGRIIIKLIARSHFRLKEVSKPRRELCGS
jgi:hypothetical protein